MAGARAWRKSTALAVLACANAIAWIVGAACTHDWDAFDPRLGEQPDAGAGPDARPDAGDADTGADADADAPVPHVTDGLLALYDFEEGRGDVVGDTSGRMPALDLTIADPTSVTWIPGGLSIVAPTIVKSEGPATKVIDGCMATNAITLEIWFRPAILSQGGPARLITNSVDTAHRNFTLGQEEASYYQARLRSTGCLDAGADATVDATCADNATPYLETPTDAGDVTTIGITHLLYTRDPAGERHLYENGVERAADTFGGDFSNWDTDFPLALANEITLNRIWLGDLYRAAIYDRALSPDEVTQSYNAGP